MLQIAAAMCNVRTWQKLFWYCLSRTHEKKCGSMFLCLCTHIVSEVKLHKYLYIFCIIYHITINSAIKSYVERIASNEKLNMLVLVNWSNDELIQRCWTDVSSILFTHTILVGIQRGDSTNNWMYRNKKRFDCRWNQNGLMRFKRVTIPNIHPVQWCCVSCSQSTMGHFIRLTFCSKSAGNILGSSIASAL